MRNFRRTLRTTIAIGGVGACFVLFCVGAVDRERRAAEREGLVATRSGSATSAFNVSGGENVFVPFDSPRAQGAADRAVAEFLRTTERRTDSPEASDVRRARILEARRRFSTFDAVEERRSRRVDDARTADAAVKTLREWASAPHDGEFNDFTSFDGAVLNVDSSFVDVEPEKINDFNALNDFDGEFDPDLAAATAFLAELSDEPSESSVPLAPLVALDDAGDFRDAAVFLDANALTPVPVAVEAVVGDAAPRTLAAVAAFQAFFAFFGALGARFFAVDWARFFSTWNSRRLRVVANAAPSERSLFSFERWGATRTLAELAVVRLLN